MAEGDLHACIFHERRKALNVYSVRDTLTGNFYKYGLCPACDSLLKRKPHFAKFINEKLCELDYKLKKQEENKNGERGKIGNGSGSNSLG